MDSDSGLHWKERSRETTFESPIFRLTTSDRESAEGKRGRFLIVDCPDWVTVIPVFRSPAGSSVGYASGSDDGQAGGPAGSDGGGAEHFVLVRQFRHGAERITMEFPGGIIDEGETPEAAAARELTEETGYVSESITLLGTSFPNPALMTNRCHIFLARDARPLARQSLDELEAISVRTVPVSAILAGNEPEFDRHAIMLAALELYRRR